MRIHQFRPILAVLLLIAAQPAWSVAFCALRDPVNTIYTLFPEADSYRSSVKTVGRHAREAVVNQLPLDLHFNELGRHTLYVALKDGATIGFVHARSEMGEWGITEYAWGISPSLEIRDVVIQRSRDPSIRTAEDSTIAATVRNQRLPELSGAYRRALEDSNALKRSLLSSAMKTLVITKAVWPSEVVSAATQGAIEKHIQSPYIVTAVASLYDETALSNLAALGLTESPAFERSMLEAYRLQPENLGDPLLLVRAPFDIGDQPRVLWWIVDSDGEVISVFNEGSQTLDERFDSVIGYAPHSLQDCSSLVDLAALELATLSRRHSPS